MVRLDQEIRIQNAASTNVVNGDGGPALHGGITPLEVRPSDGMSVKLQLAGRAEWHAARIWRLSPLAIEIVWDTKLPFLTLETTIQLEVLAGATRAAMQGTVSAKWNEQGRDIVGFAFAAPSADPADGASDQRRGQRMRSPLDLAPLGRAENPLRFADIVYFSIRDIAPSGMQFVCSTRNRTLVPGLELDAVISFPEGAPVPLRFVIRHVRVSSDSDGQTQRLAVGARFVSPSAAAREAIGQYALRFGSVSPTTLTTSGITPSSVRRAVDFGFSETEDDYDAVVALRRLAYGGRQSAYRRRRPRRR